MLGQHPRPAQLDRAVRAPLDAGEVEAELKRFWGYADGSGGVAIVETDSAATITRATAPFTPWLRFSTTPILPVEDASAIAGEAAAARASFGG